MGAVGNQTTGTKPNATYALPSPPAEAFDTTVAAGDWLVTLGSPWFAEDYTDRIATARKRHGVRFALLVYDIIPIRRPEWVDRSLAKQFVPWCRKMLPLADCLLAISRTTAEDVERYAVETGLELQGPVQAIPLGTGFGESWRRAARHVCPRRKASPSLSPP